MGFYTYDERDELDVDYQEAHDVDARMEPLHWHQYLYEEEEGQSPTTPSQPSHTDSELGWGTFSSARPEDRSSDVCRSAEDESPAQGAS